MKCKIEAALLQNPIGKITELIGEAEIVVTPDEMSIQSMDAANVAMVVFKLPRTSFVEWNVTETEKIGLNLTKLKTLMKRAGPDEFISLESKDNQVIVGCGTRKRYTQPMIDLETKQQKMPELNFTAKLTMPASKFAELIGDIEIVAESMAVEANDNKKAIVTGEGDLSKATIEIIPETDEKAKTRTLVESSAPSKSKYSIEYLQKMVAPKLSSEVTWHFSKDYPMKLVYVNDKFSLIYILAPRVEND